MKLILENWRKFLNEEEKRPIHIFFDMDGVLVDFAGSVSTVINNNLKRAREGEPIEDIHPKSKSSRNMLKKLVNAEPPVEQVSPEELEKINLKKDTGGERSPVEKIIGNYLMSLVSQGEEIWLNMKKIEGSDAMVQMAKKVAGPENIYVLSSPVDEASVSAKKKWIQNHFPNDFKNRVIITGEKGAALKKLGILEKNEIPILIDDRFKYLNQFYIAGGQAIHHTPAGSAGVKKTLDKLKQSWGAQKPRTSSGQELVLHNGLILKIPPFKNIEQLIQRAQEKYSQILPEGEEFTKIDKLHITLISAPIWKGLIFKQKQNIIKNLKLPEGIIDTNQVFLATRKLEGRKTLYVKIQNSDKLNQALQETEKDLPNKYMHISIANVHGGDSYKSVGDINGTDEGQQKNIVPAIQQQKKKVQKQEPTARVEIPIEIKPLGGILRDKMTPVAQVWPNLLRMKERPQVLIQILKGKELSDEQIQAVLKVLEV